MRRLGVALAWVALGCASPADAYRRGLAEGDRAYHAGRFVDAARAYERAAEGAAPRDADDARYRAAMACRRAGDLACERRLLVGVAARGRAWDHGPRARLELAALSTDATAEAASLDALMLDAPDTGPGRGALRRRLRALDAGDPTGAAALAWLDAMAADDRITRSLLYESVLAERATRVEATGDAAAAERAWRRLLSAVPYPDNSRWDDGHLALARLQRAAGRPRDAIATIDAMLAVRERSWGNGSYAAPRFDDGAMLRAEILRDDLRELDEAARAYHRVYAEHPTSLRRDDALWAEGELLRGPRPDAACRVWHTLVVEFPCQRFAARAREAMLACPRGRPPAPACARTP